MFRPPQLKHLDRANADFDGCPIALICGVEWWGDPPEDQEIGCDLHYQRHGVILIREDGSTHAWRAQTFTVFPRQHCDVEAEGEVAPTPEFALSELLCCLLALQAALLAALRAVEIREWEATRPGAPPSPWKIDVWQGHTRPAGSITLTSTRRRVLFGPPTETEDCWIARASEFPHADGLDIEARGSSRAAVLRKLRRELQSGALRARENARYVEWILKEARASR